MTSSSAIHDTFTIERHYPVPVARVFEAFSSLEAKTAWGGMREIQPATGAAAESEFDFCVGGHERHGHVWRGRTHRYHAVYFDIVPNHRIVYVYEMHADGIRMSVSVTTIEFAETETGTALTFTEQGAFLNGVDGPEAPVLRRNGSAEVLDHLDGYLARSHSESL